MHRKLLWALPLVIVLAACNAKPGSQSPSGAGSTSGGGGADAGPPDAGQVVSDPLPAPSAQPASVEVSPTAPADDTGAALGWSSAPVLDGVQVAPNRDSAVLVLPSVAGARDFRVIALPAGVQVTTASDGTESVSGSTLWCAGYRQHNAPAGPRELLSQVEVTGLTQPTRLVVEAIDQPCPFAGVQGLSHQDIDVTFSEVEANAQGVFSVLTEADIRGKYGNLLINGHGPGARPGRQADAVPTRVLARTTVKVTPHGVASAPLPFFDDFDQPDQPQFVSDLPDLDRTQQGHLFQNTRWSFYTYGAVHSQFFIDRGQLHTLLADWEQDIFSSNIAYPRQPVQLSSSDFLRVTYEVGSDATSRRYWWLSLCGAETLGQTMDASGKLMGNIIQTPFFMDNDGRNPSVEGWNCLQVFPRQGWPFGLPPDDSNPQSEVRVMVNKPGNLDRSSVVNVSPLMYESTDIGPPSWFRQIDASHQPSAPILDDQQLIAPRTRFDLYVRRDRVVLYVNGQQRICNDLGSNPLSMAEGALGFGHVLYHSAGERIEFNEDYWDRRGQYYYLENTPFIDVRAWDNLGYQEHAGLPQGFDDRLCFTPTP